jgi:hypothetical protein
MFLRLTYVNHLASLQSDPSKVVIVLDFTKFGLLDDGNVHSFVVSLLSRGGNQAAMSCIFIYSF